MLLLNIVDNGEKVCSGCSDDLVMDDDDDGFKIDAGDILISVNNKENEKIIYKNSQRCDEIYCFFPPRIKQYDCTEIVLNAINLSVIVWWYSMQ